MRLAPGAAAALWFVIYIERVNVLSHGGMADCAPKSLEFGRNLGRIYASDLCVQSALQIA